MKNAELLSVFIRQCVPEIADLFVFILGLGMWYVGFVGPGANMTIMTSKQINKTYHEVNDFIIR